MQKIIDEFNAVQEEIQRLKRAEETYGGANRSERRQKEKRARREAKKRVKVPA